MKKNRITKIALFVVFYCLCFFESGLFAIEADKAADTKSENEPQGVVQRPKEEFDGAGLRDPFRDYFSGDSVDDAGSNGQGKLPEVTLPTLGVQGIICGGRINQAIVNNKIVKTGDMVEGALITNIDKQGVTFFYSNKSFIISSPAAATLQGLMKKPEGGQDEK